MLTCEFAGIDLTHGAVLGGFLIQIFSSAISHSGSVLPLYFSIVCTPL